jgi:hypothetical protein
MKCFIKKRFIINNVYFHFLYLSNDLCGKTTAFSNLNVDDRLGFKTRLIATIEDAQGTSLSKQLISLAESIGFKPWSFSS